MPMRIPAHIYVGGTIPPVRPQQAAGAAPVAPAQPNRRQQVHIGSERRWLLGPLEGWVVFTLLLLAVGGWLVWSALNVRFKPACPVPCSAVTVPVVPPTILPALPPVLPLAPPVPVVVQPVVVPPSPASTPPPVRATAPVIVNFPPVLTVETPGVERAANRLADALRHNSVALPPVTTQSAIQSASVSTGNNSATERARRLEEWSRRP